MIPFGAIIGVIIALRLLNGNQGGQQQADPYGTKAGYLALTVLLILPATLFTLFGLLNGVWFFAPFFLLGLALCFPWTIARCVFIPLGWPRAAYRFGYLAMASWGSDPRGGQALAAAWALLRTRNPSPEDRAFVETKLEEADSSLRGAGIVAHGLMAAARGDLETARVLCRSVSILDQRIAPRLARKLALEWCLADTAAQGRWRDVLELSERGTGSYSFAAFFRAAARRLLAEPRAGRFILGVWWVLARRWWATWPLLKLAWRPPPRRFALPELDAGEPQAAEPLGRALELHAALSRVPVGQEVLALSAAAVAWDEALSSRKVRDLTAERAQGLGPHTGTEALDALGVEVSEELAAWALAREVKLAQLEPGSDMVERVAYRVRNELLERVESAAQDMENRLAERRPLASEEEWRHILALQHQCTQAASIGGLEARRLAFEAVNVPLCNLGVWLFNEREEKAIANGMFRWLLDESRAVGTDEDCRRYQNNVGCGP
ncbi:hypothetical protein [Archangium lansingense]|uniref:Uncharacterized protein n=1 Tax=Archangium lansingense TaxID=2995310 RepID=A0ABT4AM48_9BACT|nr:hypothetical protein [Archangium lansinium]MCY1081892.1 hypothetical protein [Archangium lansinium]